MRNSKCIIFFIILLFNCLTEDTVLFIEIYLQSIQFSIVSQELTFVYYNWYFSYKLLLHCLAYLGNVSIVSLKIAFQVSIYIKAPLLYPINYLPIWHIWRYQKLILDSLLKKSHYLTWRMLFFLMSMTFFHDKIDSDLFSFLYLTNLKQPEKIMEKKYLKQNLSSLVWKKTFLHLMIVESPLSLAICLQRFF